MHPWEPIAPLRVMVQKNSFFHQKLSVHSFCSFGQDRKIPRMFPHHPMACCPGGFFLGTPGKNGIKGTFQRGADFLEKKREKTIKKTSGGMSALHDNSRFFPGHFLFKKRIPATLFYQKDLPFPKWFPKSFGKCCLYFSPGKILPADTQGPSFCDDHG